MDTDDLEKDWGIAFDTRLEESTSSRALIATLLFHAIRDYIDGDTDADRWIFSDDSDESDEKKLEFTAEGELGHISFSAACYALDLNPTSIQKKLVCFSTEELHEIKKRLRRSRSAGPEPRRPQRECIEDEDDEL